MQDALQAAKAAGTQKNPVAKLSAHQVGLAVDFGPNINAPYTQAIHNALISAGLEHKVQGDPPHYATPDVEQYRNRAMADACEAAYNALP